MVFTALAFWIASSAVTSKTALHQCRSSDDAIDWILRVGAREFYGACCDVAIDLGYNSRRF